MKKLTNDALCDAVVNDTYIEVKDLKEMKKQPNIEEIYVKLNKYEKLDKEQGCPLEVIINACINGFIARWYGDWENEELQVNDRGIVVDFKRKCFTDNYCNEYFWKDYKVTWWLKEDKSE